MRPPFADQKITYILRFIVRECSEFDPIIDDHGIKLAGSGAQVSLRKSVYEFHTIIIVYSLRYINNSNTGVYERKTLNAILLYLFILKKKKIIHFLRNGQSEIIQHD